MERLHKHNHDNDVFCLQASWATSSKKQSDKLLEVIRRLAEDDKDGVMANKVGLLQIMMTKLSLRKCDHNVGNWYIVTGFGTFLEFSSF